MTSTCRIDSDLYLELISIKKSMDNDKFYEFIKWAKDEYINFMLVTRDDYKKTLKWIIDNNSDFSNIAKIFKKYINNYGSTKSFYITSIKILNRKQSCLIG